MTHPEVTSMLRHDADAAAMQRRVDWLSESLESCPWCRGEAEFHWPDGSGSNWQVGCSGCSAMGTPFSKSPDEAADHWNRTRHLPKHAAEVVRQVMLALEMGSPSLPQIAKLSQLLNPNHKTQ